MTQLTVTHISTAETFMTNAIVMEDSECHVCGLIGTLRHGWVNTHCSRCNQYYDHEMWSGQVVMQIRHAMNLNRNQFSLMLGIKPSTLKRAEFVKCPLKHLNKAKCIFKEFVSSKEPSC